MCVNGLTAAGMDLYDAPRVGFRAWRRPYLPSGCSCRPKCACVNLCVRSGCKLWVVSYRRCAQLLHLTQMIGLQTEKAPGTDIHILRRDALPVCLQRRLSFTQLLCGWMTCVHDMMERPCYAGTQPHSSTTGAVSCSGVSDAHEPKSGSLQSQFCCART